MSDAPETTPTQLPGPKRAPSGRGGYAGGRGRPGSGMELWWWMFMRVSGIILLFLAVGHVLIMHTVDEGIDRVDFGFVAVRWESMFWRTWDWLLLTLALLHGMNGLRVIIGDYVRHPGARAALNWFFWAITFAIFILGTVVVTTFDPTKWGPV